MKNKSGEKVFTEAAELIHAGRQEYSCNAVSTAEGGIYFRGMYIEVMGDYDPATQRYFFMFTKVERAATEEVPARELRIWLLLMMAACYEDFF